MGPGSDDTGTPVYSINQVFANVVFDGEGKILAIYVDQLEYATPNYDGASHAPLQRLARPGRLQQRLETTTPWWTAPRRHTEEQLHRGGRRLGRPSGSRGDDYVMGTGTWTEQMDAFQQLFVGMTVDEVEEWFAKYCSDANGRPLQGVEQRRGRRGEVRGADRRREGHAGRRHELRHHEPERQPRRYPLRHPQGL